MKDRRPATAPDKKFLIAGIGELVWDLYPGQRSIGGTPANVALHARQLGNEAVLVSRVGNDAPGRELIEALRQRGVNSDFIQTDPHKPTGTVAVTLDPHGLPSFRCSHEVAFDALCFTPALAALAATCDAVLFSLLSQRSSAAAETIRNFVGTARRAVKVLDPNARTSAAELQKLLPPSLRLADIVKMNEEELHRLHAALAHSGESVTSFIRRLMREYDLALVAITRGGQGCELFSRDEHHTCAGMTVPVVDTTGAGDAFAAALIHRYLRGASLAELGSYANRVAAAACTKLGASPLLTSDEIAYHVPAEQTCSGPAGR
ncbi:MAG: carbohydrate kinase [candidate division KSB1 bacterium]|nr:carbohydrate kinase [candidate division KSB1 bacterium]MDZ7273717.1 carbohydrate kinase [candidate division KSB1 bacterium]MDZ7285873.1 carbohydrate kinase [candidate division KSB1 bacterium]MDZ7298905.1 carbohydrate kinase [candidate division KSB1 bacterium]MDZ7309467.1 carbohydrate kinase [candidate division KSB1 bacterium]